MSASKVPSWALVGLLFTSHRITALSTQKSLSKLRGRESGARSFVTNYYRFSRLDAHRKAFNNDATENNIVEIEKEVLASVQAKMDAKRIRKILDEPDMSQSSVVPQWKIALAAASLTGTIAGVWSHSLVLFLITSVIVFVTANQDPLEDNLAGALARIVGRNTLRAVQDSQPTVKAVARAVVTGQDEVLALRQEVATLREENAALRKWKQRRILVDEALPRFSLEKLKEKARQEGLVVGGTKSQLLMRLVEAEVIELD